MTESYSATQLQVLEGLEAVRKRPGMYIGSTDSRGIMHCLWEIIDNSVDEALAGYGSRIDVILHADSSVEVRDQGRGIPTDVEPRTGWSGVQVVYTKLHAGGKFGSANYGAAGGLHGVGASVVNALSSRLDVEVDRGGKTHKMSFQRGHAGIFKDPVVGGEAQPSPDSPFTEEPGKAELHILGKTKRGVTGTRVRYWADPQIFVRDADFQVEQLRDRARQTAFLVPGLEIELQDLRDPEAPTTETFKYDGGISEYVEYLAPDGPLTDVWRIEGEGNYSETVPVLDPKSGHMVSTEVERTMQVDLALRWGIGYDTVQKSYVNIISTPKGGTHVAGFEAGMLRTIRDEVQKNARRLKVGNDKIEKDDVLAGLTAVVTVRIPEPQFEGQTKEVLGTPQARNIVQKTITDGLKERFNSTKRQDKTEASMLLEKVVTEMKSRIAARAHKETQRRKTALENSSLPAKLVDCRSNEVERSELFIVEGDSALGTAKPARNSEFQALFPIRGKILNVQKASLADMLKNAECANIIQVLGAGSGRTFDLSQIRYGKVIIMSDADVDGAHIRTLLLTLFFRYMRPMLEDGRVFAAVPPLHRVVVQNPGKKPNDTIYTYSENELQQLLSKLERSGKKYVEPIQRYKGLGEMDEDQLWDTTMNPEHRILRRMTMTDAAEAESVFEMLMGSEVAPRREFIVEGADHIDSQLIDT
ncbi:DNA gyrase/topoisomerase IV subunit B [Gulosibacter molinativorax]|uniref:DNA topoisomerase (ATP-hydrolyzing) n=1 Tax=Gulosibacter molinativorax TaxID=256821 RepID=A0ABT7C657_9MICO|nr:DNA topoisomerase IV subunit B [Gulosibacter molinativorax]MDJ1370156.1 type IIA DNA topoisomerase subunit B [Gulosibacter molinativorax]QUY61567.1 DNA topoisomerase (ATP-hydrolyzing) [Gulosibacter molinativorax]